MTTMDLEFQILYNSLTGIFKLIYRPKNFCWATSNDLSHLLETLKRVLVKYKNRLTFERTLVRLDSYKPRDSWGKSQEELYRQGEAESFKGLIEMTVQEAIEEIDWEDTNQWEEISMHLVRTGKFFALRIKGDSMSPRMVEGGEGHFPISE